MGLQESTMVGIEARENAFIEELQLRKMLKINLKKIIAGKENPSEITLLIKVVFLKSRLSGLNPTMIITKAMKQLSEELSNIPEDNNYFENMKEFITEKVKEVIIDEIKESLKEIVIQRKNPGMPQKINTVVDTVIKDTKFYDWKPLTLISIAIVELSEELLQHLAEGESVEEQTQYIRNMMDYITARIDEKKSVSQDNTEEKSIPLARDNNSRRKNASRNVSSRRKNVPRNVNSRRRNTPR